MPIVSVWVMPAGLLALAAMPFGFDGPLWYAMGQGIQWMDAVALWVASLPGAVGRIPAFGIGALVAATAGLCLICLLRSRLRWSGLLLVVVAIVMVLGRRSPTCWSAQMQSGRRARSGWAPLRLAQRQRYWH